MVVRKMKDKCKDAARMRREKERAEFVELSRLLPLPSSTTSQLDKASIIRLTSSYLRMRAAFPEGLGENWGQHGRQLKRHLGQSSQAPSASSAIKQGGHQIKELGSLILQTLDGFVFAMHRDGKIMYISETASVHLGLPQIDLTGSSVYEYIHPSDRDDIRQILSLSEAESAQLTTDHTDQVDDTGCSHSEVREFGRSFCMRMKCILPKRNAGLVTSGYKAIHCNGYLKVRCKQQPTQDKEWEGYALVAVGHSLLPTASTEVKMTTNSFMFRASLDFKFYHVESMMGELLGYEQSDLIGQSLYQFVHVNDLQHFEKSHRLLLDKGQAVGRYYRLMRRDGGLIWVQNYATLVNNPRNVPKPQHIVSVCMILGDDPYDQSVSLYDRCEPTGSNKKLDELLLEADSYNDSQRTHQHPSQTSLASATKSVSGRSKRDKLGRKKMRPLAGPKSQTASKSNTHTAPIKRASLQDRTTTAIDGHRAQPQLANHHENHRAGHLHHLVGSPNLSAALAQASEFHAGREPLTSGAGFTIGSIRRASDDSCSIVSSVASTSLSSGSSALHLTEPESSYLLGGSLGDNCPTHERQHHNHHHHHHHHSHQHFQTVLSADSNLLAVCAADDCHQNRSVSMVSMNQPDSSTWPPRPDELSASMDLADNCHHYQAMDSGQEFNVGTNQFVQMTPPISQPWVAQVQVCSSSFGTSELNLDNHVSDFHHEQHLQQQQQHHQSTGEIYIETHQSYSSYANHPSAAIHFHQVPPATNLYTV